MFRALLVDRDGDEVTCDLADLTDDDLPSVGDDDDPEVLVDVEYSTVNYKDALAVTNSSPIVRSWPMVPGIDLAGTVAASDDPDVQVGQRVVVNGWGIGEDTWGGFAERARVRSSWTVPLPDGLSTAEAMAIGTAGYTAILCVLALDDHDITPEKGPVLVTGAVGGVGSVAVALLSSRGYEVHASTGRPEEAEYLESLGATTIVERGELSGAGGRPLARARWAGAVDGVGSHTLANVLAQIQPEGCVAACGLAQGADLTASVMPFILRGVTLRGVHSVYVPQARRLESWARLDEDLDRDLLSSMSSTIDLADVPAIAAEVLAGRIRGRTVVDLAT